MRIIPVLGKLRQGLRAGIHEHPTSKGSVCQKLGPQKMTRTQERSGLEPGEPGRFGVLEA